MFRSRFLMIFFGLFFCAQAVAQPQEDDHFYWRNVAIGATTEQMATLNLPVFVFAGRSLASEGVRLPEVCSLEPANVSIFGADDIVSIRILADVASRTKAKLIVVAGFPEVGELVGGIPVAHIDDAPIDHNNVQLASKDVDSLSARVIAAVKSKVPCVVD